MDTTNDGLEYVTPASNHHWRHFGDQYVTFPGDTPLFTTIYIIFTVKSCECNVHHTQTNT